MLIVNIIIIVALAFGVGFYLGKGKIEITRKANKATSAEMVRIQAEMLKIQKDMEEAQKKHLAEYNAEFGDLGGQ